jgi:hypothetical protein
MRAAGSGLKQPSSDRPDVLRRRHAITFFGGHGIDDEKFGSTTTLTRDAVVASRGTDGARRDI